MSERSEIIRSVGGFGGRSAADGRAKRALVIVHSYYFRDTRAQRHASALAARGWEIDVLCMRNTGEPFSETHGSIRVRRLPARRRGGSPFRKIFEYCWFTLLGFFAVTGLWLRRRQRLVYVLGIPNFIVFCALVPRLMGARVLLDMRDPFPEFFLAKYDAADKHPLLPVLLLEERLSARFASGVLTVVPSLVDLFTRSVPRSRIELVWNAPDPSLFGARPSGDRDPDDRTLLYVGTVTLPYGVDLAVRAVASLCGSIPRLRIRIIGEGDLFETIEQIARAEGISDRVVLEPSVPLDRIPEIVGRAWMGVQPNRRSLLMRYSFSTKILEWCRAGLPVVAGRTPPLADAFPNGEILFHEPGDLEGLCARIAEADRDADALADRARRAREAIERIRFDDQIDAFLRVAEGTTR